MFATLRRLARAQYRPQRQARLIAIALALAATAHAPLAAQWFKYPTPGVPRTASGAVDVKAPAPRAADGNPDLSGVWLAGNPLPCPPLLRDGNDCAEKTALSAWAFHIDAGLQGGLPYQPWAAAIVKRRSDDNSKDDPHVQCLPSNPPRAYTLPHYQKIVQTPRFVVMLHEFNASFRQIFTDGRPLPVDPQPSWTGYSTGRWDGDTLVVQTNGLRDGLWLDMAGNPLTDAATLTERIRRPNFGTLQVDFTVDDPKAYTRPWTVRLEQIIVVDEDLIEEICLEGVKPLHVAPK
jgi:hypothetical protein